MMKNKLYLAIQTVVCIALAALLSCSAVSIYREGSARRAENSMESIYTPEVVAERFAPIAPLFFTGVGLLIAGLALGAQYKKAEKPARDAEGVRDLAAARVVHPSDAMKRERAAQKRLRMIGRGAFALCMLPIGIYAADPAHFPPEDLEGMFRGLLRVLLPWIAAGLGALAVTSALAERSVLRETEAARARTREERAEGIQPEAKEAPLPNGPGAIQATIVVAAVILIVMGVFNQSARDVFYKAISICTECVGLG